MKRFAFIWALTAVFAALAIGAPPSVASTHFTPEQIAALAEMSAAETAAAAEKSPTTGLTAAQSSELAAMTQAEREALALKSPPAVALIDCGV